MPWQLIYTSAPRGLLSGQSGFCTVARSAELREALVQRLEQISSYHYLRVAEAATANRNPTISVFRILDFRGSKYYVLTRIQPCGLDFTGRTNHLAHHLVFQIGELTDCPSPAMILQHWEGWRTSWDGEPRLLENPPLGELVVNPKPYLPAQSWFRMAGDAGKAAGLLESDCLRGCSLVCPPGSEQQLLEMFCETLQLLNLTGQYPLRPWRHPFTTFLQAEDNPADFQWRGCQEGTPAYQQAMQRQTPLIPLPSIRVPNNSLVKVAREGLKPPPRPPSEASSSTSSGRRGLARNPKSPAPAPLIVSLEPEVEDTPKKRGALALRIGIFLAVLVSLILIKYWHGKNNSMAEPEVTPPPAAAPRPVPEAKAAPPVESTTNAPPDQEELKFLSSDGPTYLFPVVNLTNFSLPIDSIILFKHVINNFDGLKTLGRDIQLSFNTDQWDFQNGTPLIVTARKGRELTATSESGPACSFDYANWQDDSSKPVGVVDTFSNARAFSIHFGFSSPNDDPFRILIVNQNNPPAPLHLKLHWLNLNCEGIMASVRAPMGERLIGNLTLPNGVQWQLQPFVRRGRQIKYLYNQWPPDQLPPMGDELDFVEVKRRLAVAQEPIKKKLDLLDQRLEKQQKKVNLDLPLGRDFQLTNQLVSFSTFAGNGDSTDFIKYLNALKKHARIPKWPFLSDTESEDELAEKFRRIHDLWVDQVPDSRQSLTVGNTNYFYAAWRSLNLIEKIEQDEQHVARQLTEMEDRAEEVPTTLDQVAYVGLVIADSSGSRRALEMIRFE